MLAAMPLLLDSFWRAVAYCLHPRVIVLSLLPLVLLMLGALGLSYFYWDSAVQGVLLWLESSVWLSKLGAWLQDMGLGGLKAVVAPLVVLFAVTPLVIVAVLLFVALLMMPALVSLVARRRFPTLERKHGASFLLGALWSLGSTTLALFGLIVSLPLWLIPPLILILPPLIWGWLTYRVMAFDALADHASAEERKEVFRRHRMMLLGMGVATGYMGAAPSVVWASGWFFAAAFVFLVPVAMWIYTLVFAFASLWFAHYCLAALQELRTERAAPVPVPSLAGDTAADAPPAVQLALPDDRTLPP
jgi:hypothetical protein